jgi:hypothetical protein
LAHRAGGQELAVAVPLTASSSSKGRVHQQPSLRDQLTCRVEAGLIGDERIGSWPAILFLAAANPQCGLRGAGRKRPGRPQTKARGFGDRQRAAYRPYAPPVGHYSAMCAVVDSELSFNPLVRCRP